MKHALRFANCLLAASLLVVGQPSRGEAKGYSSGGGRSYSSSPSRSSSSGGSHASSSGGSKSSSAGSGHTFSSGGAHTFSSGSSPAKTSTSSTGGSGHSATPAPSASKSPPASRTSSTGTADGGNFHSGSGRSYSSGSNWSDTNQRGYNSAKSYTSGSGNTFSPVAGNMAPAQPPRQPATESSPSAFPFDTAAARARKEQASQADFARFKEAKAPPPKTPVMASTAEPVAPTPRAVAASAAIPPVMTPSYQVRPPPLPSPTTYVPDATVILSRPYRSRSVFSPYTSRPVVIYQDPYDSFFWWWLLDRTVDQRASWAYHHRYDMDPARYQALVANNQELEARVEQLEVQQVPRDPNYVPAELERDLMYSDRHVSRAYSNRPTPAGILAFWVIGVPAALFVSGFFIWLIWFKRWQTTT